MNVKVSAYHESAECVWCEKATEGVTVDFDDNFLRNATICWKCFQKSVRVRSRQERQTTPSKREG